MSVRRQPPAYHPTPLLQVATEVLVADPAASMTDVAKAAGIGRTTLHKLYSNRHALLVAIAEDALELLERAYTDADLDVGGEQALDALYRLVELIVPLGPRLEFLLRERALDNEPHLINRVDALDERARTLVRRGQRAEVLRADLPDEWVISSLNAIVYSAWESISLGRLAPASAPALVMSTLIDGIRARR